MDSLNQSDVDVLDVGLEMHPLEALCHLLSREPFGVLRILIQRGADVLSIVDRKTVVSARSSLLQTVDGVWLLLVVLLDLSIERLLNRAGERSSHAAHLGLLPWIDHLKRVLSHFVELSLVVAL